jgi:heparan-alpha-glucosaminide N-acetyltransferase
MGNLTGVLLCYLGVQAGHIFVHSTRVGRICTHWLVAGIICGTIGLILSHGGQSNSWIPINKNLWSLTFVLILSSLAYLILTILYIVVDVRKWFTGAPFLWLGMNSIVIYIGHDRFAYSFPVQVAVESTHAAQLTVHLFGAFFWSLVAGFMYYKKFFIAI